MMRKFTQLKNIRLTIRLLLLLSVLPPAADGQDSHVEEVSCGFDDHVCHLMEEIRSLKGLVNGLVQRNQTQETERIVQSLEAFDGRLNNVTHHFDQVLDDVANRLDQSLDDVSRRLEDQDQSLSNITRHLDQSNDVIDNVTRHLDAQDRSLNDVTRLLEQSLNDVTRHLDQSLSNVTCNMEVRDHRSTSTDAIYRNHQPKSQAELLEDIFYSLDRPRDCNDISSRNDRIGSKVYRVFPSSTGKTAMDVVCDMKTPNGPWLVIQRRTDGSVDFFRNWKNYSNGFGDLNGEFWLGNENLHLLTSNGRYKLRVELEDFERNKRYAEYSSFSISSSNDFYRLNVSGFSGNAGDSFSPHDGERFSAEDVDNDSDENINCAAEHRGGWWYRYCYQSNLNGLYLRGTYTTPDNAGIVWYKWRGQFYSLKTTEMKISRID